MNICTLLLLGLTTWYYGATFMFFFSFSSSTLSFFHFHQGGMVFMGLGAALPNHIPACRSEFWSYLSHFILNFDGVKSKVGLLNPCRLSSCLASPPASPPEMPWLAIIFLVISQPLQVKFWWCEKQCWSLVYLINTIYLGTNPNLPTPN